MPDLASAFMALAAAAVQCGGSWLGSPGSPRVLEQNAAVIVVGTGKPCAPATDVCFTVQVERMIKGGEDIEGSSLTVNLADPCIPVVRQGHGIWFLPQDTSSSLTFTVKDRNRKMIPAPEGPINSAYAYPETATVDDKLAAELSAAVEFAVGNHVRNFDLDYVDSGGLDELKSPVTKILWTRMSSSSSGPERLLGLAGLIRSGSIDAVITAAKEAESLAPHQQEFIALLRSIVDSFHPADDAAVVTLGQIATDPAERLDIRQATGHALAASGNPAAIQFLKMMATEADSTLRLESRVGLGGH